MTFPINPAASTFVPLTSSSPLGFQTQAYASQSGFHCERCLDYINVISNLQLRVAMLDVQLLNAEKEKTEAERLMRHLIRLKDAAMGKATAIDPTNQNNSELRCSLFQANAEKACMKIMLERAWNKIADLTVSGTSLPGSKHSLATDSSQHTENLLPDLLGPIELPNTGCCVKDLCSVGSFEGLNEVEETESIINPAHGGEAELLLQEDIKRESDSLPDNSYIFRFVSERNHSNDPRKEDEIIVMVRMPNPILNDSN